MARRSVARKIVAYAFSACLALVVLAPTHASAAPPHVSFASSGLFVGGIDDTLALGAGNIIRYEGTDKVLVDGRSGAELARIPRDSAEARRLAIAQSVQSASGGLGTQGVVYGNCGSSYMYLKNISQNDLYQFKTGFDLTAGSAFDFDWYLHMFLNDGSYDFYWEDHGPMFSDPHWTSLWRTDDVGKNGTMTARVTSGTAYTTNGLICFSGYPTASAYVS